MAGDRRRAYAYFTQYRCGSQVPLLLGRYAEARHTRPRLRLSFVRAFAQLAGESGLQLRRGRSAASASAASAATAASAACACNADLSGRLGDLGDEQLSGAAAAAAATCRTW